MKRTVLSFTLAALMGALLSVPACNSSSAGSSADAGGDSAIGPGQIEGAPCDPTLADPCLQAPCATVRCDPVQLVCLATPLTGPCGTTLDASFVFDSGGDSGPIVVVAACNSNADCPPVASLFDGGAPVQRVCGFSAFDGCSASGVCVIPAPPLTQDGAAEIACGCDDQPVAWVTDVQTASPVQSPAPCVGPDSGAPTGIDAASDAPADATLDAAADAPFDAPVDAAADDGG
jgi:hypothetical protein